ncbi:interleukin-1 receptor-like 2 [Echinops telfairi]|uniref:Interleukin-1 receptor-like 2 n=1 Tax=Echinops telfairi TaxID=9371 RepID=A0AC55CKN2_ECHTE|nr:interleukin-1 receptor-like 2 [Echinops telfairi]
MISVGQPFAFNCTLPPQTLEEVNITWFRNTNKIPISKNLQSRIHQEQSWILFLPMTQRDAGIYQCVIKTVDSCYRIHVNLIVFKKYWCRTSRKSPTNLSDEYIQTLHFGKDDSLTCHLNFPESCVLELSKWYKECKEIKEERFNSVGMKLFVKNVSAEDRGMYACLARLTHEGKNYTVLNDISVDVRKLEYGVPKITYPRNNTIEVELGSPLTVTCNITDFRDNTNLRCWKVNNTQVNRYYAQSKRIREGYESSVPLEQYIWYTVNITFNQVDLEDYDRPFVCHAGVSAAYIMLKFPVSDPRAYLIGGFIALASAVLSVVYIYHLFKIDLVLWYRSAFLSTGNIRDGKLYDAYVLYPKPQSGSQSHNLDMLVLTILPEVLERQCGYKLFIFGRDEVPGQAVASVIDEMIKLCRRLIIIIVPESLSFGLLKNTSEEQITVYQALVQDGMQVILIELETIKDYTDMPESIKYIRQKHGAIQWSGNFMAEPQSAKTKFWKKVRYRMPAARAPSSSCRTASGRMSRN